MTSDSTPIDPDTEGVFPLPPEIIGEIAAHAAVDPADNLSTLKRCCLVNKTFRDQFQPHIYRFLDIEVEPDAKRIWEGTQTTNKILEAFKQNSKLVPYVKEIWLSLDEVIVAQDPQLPTLLLYLNEVSTFRVAAYHANFVWSDINPNLQVAILNICQLSSLRSLQLNSISQIPVTVIANPKLGQLQIVNVQAFSDDSPLPDLSSLHTLQCMYFAASKECIYRIVENPGLSESLRSLKLMMLLDPEQTGVYALQDEISSSPRFRHVHTTSSSLLADSPTAVAEQFDRPFDLSQLKKLSYLKVRFDVEPLDDHPEFAVLGCFLYLVNQILSSVDQSAPLKELHLTMSDVTHRPLLMQLVSDQWREFGASIAARDRGEGLTMQTQVKIKLALCDPDPEAELEAVPYIKDLALKAAPGLSSLILKSADGKQL